MQKPATRNAAALVFIAVTQLLLLAIALFRLVQTRESALGADACLGCQSATLVQHEAGIWAAIWLLLFLLSLQARTLKVFSTTALWALLLILVADVMVLQQFGLRLYLPDVLTYGQQPRFIVEYLQELGWWLWLPLSVTIVALPWIVLRFTRRHLVTGAARAGLLSMCGLSLLLYALPDRAASPLPWTYQNLIEANWPSGADARFSDAYLQQLQDDPPATGSAVSCSAGLGRGGDVIIVAIESLSWYHSALLLPNSLEATPNLDRLAAANSWWERFLANGFTTDHGLIAMLAGQLPVPAVNRYRSLDVFEGYAGDWRALPRRLAEDGYYSAFITSGDLGFLGKGDWLRSLGFDHVEGHDQPEYEGAKRYSFAAVSDDLLYGRVLNWLQDDRPDDRPIAAFVETVTTHPPFIDPVSGVANETAAFRFADRALADFVQALEARDYFQNGLLVIASDQRALTPIRQNELAAFGLQTGARLPLVMLGDRLPAGGRQTTAGQMLDLPFSLDFYLTDEACRLPGQGNLFTGQEPDCVYQPDGNQRSIINAFCGADAARIRMDGDRTRVIEGHLPDAERRIRELNYQRARLGIQEVNVHNVL
jgi:lipoteichoic acid synthase